MSTFLRPALSPAVENCWKAYKETYDLERGQGASDYEAYNRAKMAYRQAMPCLGEPHDIRDFIACVTYGMLLLLIPNEDGTKLLYAANVAAGSFRNETRQAKQAIKAKDANAARDAHHPQEGNESKEPESDPSAMRNAA